MFAFSYALSKDKRISILSATIAPWIYIYGFSDSFHSMFAIQPKTMLFALLPFLFYLIIKSIKRTHMIKNEYFNKEIMKAIFFSLLVVFMLFLSKIIILRPYFDIFLVLYLFFILFIVRIIFKKTSDDFKYIFLIFTIVGSTMVFIHMPMGFASFSIVLGSVFLYFLLLKEDKKNSLLYILIFFMFIFVALEIMNVISIPILKPESMSSNVGGLPEEFAFLDISQKTHAFIDGYTPLILFLFVIGFIFSLPKRKELTYIFIISFLLFIFFLPIEAIYRILVAVTPFICYFASVGITKIYLINNSVKKNRMYFGVFFIVCIGALLIFNLPNNYQSSQFTSEDSKRDAVNYMNDILIASDWIKKNTNKNTIIISDPFTMYQIAGFSDRAYISRSLSPERIYFLYDILSSPQKEMYKKIDSLDPTLKSNGVVEVLPDGCIQLYPPTNKSDWEKLIIITETTMRFMETYKKGDVFVTSGRSPIDKIFLNNFNNTLLFEKVYSIDDKIYIFRVKKQTEQNESAEY